MTDKVKEWYVSTFKSDELGKEIDDTITFDALYDLLKKQKSFCKIIGVNDSTIRERTFHELANRYTNGDYSQIYNLWYWAK